MSFIFVFYSCKKNYTCVCDGSGGVKNVFTVNDTKSNAKNKCTDYYNQNFGNIPMSETECSIK